MLHARAAHGGPYHTLLNPGVLTHVNTMPELSRTWSMEKYCTPPPPPPPPANETSKIQSLLHVNAPSPQRTARSSNANNHDRFNRQMIFLFSATRNIAIPPAFVHQHTIALLDPLAPHPVSSSSTRKAAAAAARQCRRRRQ